jgi:8-oxo-dGTP pyrophosphatase MutT (NUDIX family)
MEEGLFSNFIHQLTENLKKPLPGELAHREMEASPSLRSRFKPNNRTRRSAVLILFYPTKDKIYLPLILRPAYDGVHSGQIAFPGGRYEVHDENLIRTALREAQEEIGLRLTDVTVLGPLTELFIPPSNFYVLPVVAYMPYRPDFYPDPREVDNIIEIHAEELLNPNIKGNSVMQVRGEQITAPHYLVNGNKIWGATAMMLNELLMVLNHPSEKI